MSLITVTGLLLLSCLLQAKCAPVLIIQRQQQIATSGSGSANGGQNRMSIPTLQQDRMILPSSPTLTEVMLGLNPDIISQDMQQGASGSAAQTSVKPESIVLPQPAGQQSARSLPLLPSVDEPRSFSPSQSPNLSGTGPLPMPSNTPQAVSLPQSIDSSRPDSQPQSTNPLGPLPLPQSPNLSGTGPLPPSVNSQEQVLLPQSVNPSGSFSLIPPDNIPRSVPLSQPANSSERSSSPSSTTFQDPLPLPQSADMSAAGFVPPSAIPPRPPSIPQSTNWPRPVSLSPLVNSPTSFPLSRPASSPETGSPLLSANAARPFLLTQPSYEQGTPVQKPQPQKSQSSQQHAGFQWTLISASQTKPETDLQTGINDRMLYTKETTMSVTIPPKLDSSI
ncbi:hypothetical protein PHET_03144 [Paragonimus heterotremus]|uniref:Uncharacterized protein n=1 Tax=Paragonimus heterotremus TaxID=100268 RepID=A0A8J4T3H7_9TREM|nr:hypothetical protein PHET_03144 [Paragonimus heterotremus]